MHFKFKKGTKLRHKKVKDYTLAVVDHAKKRNEEKYGYKVKIFYKGVFEHETILPMDEIERDFKEKVK